MEFKIIAVHLDHTPACEVRVDIAARIARAHGSHLIGVVPTGLPAGDVLSLPLEEETDDFFIDDGYLALRAQAIANLFEAQIRGCRPPSHELRKADGPGIDALLRWAHASDLMVLGRPDRQACERDRHLAMTVRDLSDQVVMRSGRPVLVVPSGACPRTLGERILVAWDSSRESALATRDALPFLRRASQVTLATLGGSGRFEARREHGREMIDWLARQEVRAGFEQYLAVGGIAEGLQSCAAGMDADLIVMGGYAQGPVRELLLGGVSRDMLSQARVPILMSH